MAKQTRRKLKRRKTMRGALGSLAIIGIALPAWLLLELAATWYMGELPSQQKNLNYGKTNSTKSKAP